MTPALLMWWCLCLVAVIALCQEIRSHNDHELVAHVVERHGDKFADITYVDTFHLLRIKHEQNEEGASGTAPTPSSHNTGACVRVSCRVVLRCVAFHCCVTNGGVVVQQMARCEIQRTRISTARTAKARREAAGRSERQARASGRVMSMPTTGTRFDRAAPHLNPTPTPLIVTCCCCYYCSAHASHAHASLFSHQSVPGRRQTFASSWSGQTCCSHVVVGQQRRR
jgi:hypothetical protein